MKLNLHQTGWIVAALAAGLILALAFFLTRSDRLAHAGVLPHALLWLSVVCTAGGLFWMAWRVSGTQGESKKLLARARQAETQVELATRRLDAIFRVSQRYVEANHEKEVINLLLSQATELVGASGASFVPLDEHGQAGVALNHGKLPQPVMNDWIEYLASPAVRHRCQACQAHGTVQTICPLLKGPVSEAIGMYCLPMRRGEREIGVLNLFLPEGQGLDPATQAFLRSLIDETAITLEGVRLRQREVAALRQMQAIRQRTDHVALLTSLLENAQRALDADLAVLMVASRSEDGERMVRWLGDFPPGSRPLIEGILQGVIASGEPVLVGELAGESAAPAGMRSLVAAPLLSPERVSLGALLTGSRRVLGFQPRQMTLLQTVAGQAALLLQNADLLAEIEYKTLMAERSRLAREIHDGLAQTLGFLKLQVAQMSSVLERADTGKLKLLLQQCYQAVSDAYQEARQSIDGLRVGVDENGLQGWIEQSLNDFHELTGMEVCLEKSDIDYELSPEIQAQLIRIVQEALSNVRKHAQASKVWVACHEQVGDLWLEVRDDGVGFSPEDVAKPARHGLRGMQERAELIGADFQVISQPVGGTCVRVRLPFNEIEVQR